MDDTQQQSAQSETPDDAYAVFFKLFCLDDKIKDWLDQAKAKNEDGKIRVLRDVEDEIRQILHNDLASLRDEYDRSRRNIDDKQKEMVDKVLTATERNTLLTIIAALCDYSAIKIDGRGAATQIAKLTEEIGTPVSDDTVRRWLKQIPDARETRMR